MPLRDPPDSFTGSTLSPWQNPAFSRDACVCPCSRKMPTNQQVFGLLFTMLQNPWHGFARSWGLSIMTHHQDGIKINNIVVHKGTHAGAQTCQSCWWSKMSVPFQHLDNPLTYSCSNLSELLRKQVEIWIVWSEQRAACRASSPLSCSVDNPMQRSARAVDQAVGADSGEHRAGLHGECFLLDDVSLMLHSTMSQTHGQASTGCQGVPILDADHSRRG